ncbi:CrcB-like protein-domain-containing protein [Coemansia mojavensis]|nr:CrcB-like protein-domain-containing protein [Coemansia mojavensis]
MLGVLVRVHMTRLFTYHGAPIYGLIWAQMTGCLIMGIATRTKGILLRYSPALNLGITTGLCGSITTFSSWQLLVYEEFFNTSAYTHSQFRNFLSGTSVLVTTVACAVGALRLGQIIGDEVRLAYIIYLRTTHDERDPLYRIATKLLGYRPASTRQGWIGWTEWRTVDSMLAILGILAIMATCVVVGVARDTRSVSIAMLVGPAGTLLRWRLSSLNTRETKLPPLLTKLPLGTFIANVLGSVVLSIIHILQTGVVVQPSATSCYVLAAMADGFCGCLTTVSTFAAEISVLTPRRSAIYAIISIVAAQAFFLFIAGIYFKTATINYSVC